MAEEEEEEEEESIGEAVEAREAAGMVGSKQNGQRRRISLT